MKELVSVIIPTYGDGAFVCRAVDSVLNQTYPNIEVIVVDDNGIGTDNQKKTALQMQVYENNPKVHYVCHEVNRNGSAARNTGVNHSSGVYISLLDDDDVFMPDKVEKQVGLLNSLSSDYAFVCCSHEIYKDGKLIKINHAKKSGYLFYEKVSGQLEIQTSGILIRREIYDEFYGFDESFRRHQDWEFIERIMSKYKIKADDFVGYKRFLYGRSDASSPKQSKERRMHYLLKMEPYLRLLPQDQYQRVVYLHRIEVALRFLKEGMIIAFIRELLEIKPNKEGWRILFMKILRRL